MMVPAFVHWKLDHYSALIDRKLENGQEYLLVENPSSRERSGSPGRPWKKKPGGRRTVGIVFVYRDSSMSIRRSAVTFRSACRTPEGHSTSTDRTLAFLPRPKCASGSLEPPYPTDMVT